MPFTMPHRENFLAMMTGGEPERLPLSLPMVAPVRQRLEQHFQPTADTPTLDARLAQSFEMVIPERRMDPTPWREAYAELGVTLPERCDLSAFGFVHEVPDADAMGESVHLREMRHPLSDVESVDVLERLPFADIAALPFDSAMADRVAALQRQGLAVIGAVGNAAFEPAWYLRSMDRLFMDLYEANPVANWLLDYFADRACAVARHCCRAGVDVIWLGDDVATQQSLMMSTDFYREHIKPRHARIVQTVREHQRGSVYVAYHSDGNVSDLGPDLIDLGIDILNPVQPECMSLDEVASQHGDVLAFWGAVGTQTTMPFGSVEDVADRVNHLAELARQGVRLIAAPTHVLEPDVPDANIFALVDAVASHRL